MSEVGLIFVHSTYPPHCSGRSYPTNAAFWATYPAPPVMLYVMYGFSPLDM